MMTQDVMDVATRPALVAGRDYADLRRAVALLLSCCDGAHELDGAGFNSYDAPWAREIDLRGPWGIDLARSAYHRLAKYKGQLRRLGLDFDAIQQPGGADYVAAPARLISTMQAGPATLYQITFPYHAPLVDAVKAIPGRSFRREPSPAWLAPDEDDAAVALLALADRFQFALTKEAEALLADHHLPAVPAASAAEAPAAPASTPSKTIRVSGDYAMLRFPYDPAMIDHIKASIDWRYRSFVKDARLWQVALIPAHRDFFAELVDRFGFEPDQDAQHRLFGLGEEALASVEESKAVDSDIEIEGLPPGLTPYGYQRAGVAYAIKHERCWIADQMGLGKTVEALLAAHVADAFPMLVICPASLRLNWRREARTWLPTRRVQILEGLRPQKLQPASWHPGPDIVVVGYDVLAGRKGDPRLAGWRQAIADYGFKSVAVDESHSIKNPKAARTKAVIEICQGAKGQPGIPYVWLLTGTPILSRPSELIEQLRAMGRLADFGGPRNFSVRYCSGHQGQFGWDATGASRLEELNQRMRATCYIRRTKDQVLTDLPDKLPPALVLLDIDNRAEYNRAEADLIRWIRDTAHEDARLRERLDALPPEEHEQARREYVEWRAQKASKAIQIVQISALRRLAAKGKTASVIEWVRQFLESGEKLVLFAHHVEVQDAIAAAFPGCARIRAGDQAGNERDKQRFQEDTECRLIVCSLLAGGVGHTLTAAHDVAVVELPWTPGALDQAIDRLHRITQKSDVTPWFLLGADTIDERFARLLGTKSGTVSTTTEGEEAEDSSSILADLVAELAQAA